MPSCNQLTRRAYARVLTLKHTTAIALALEGDLGLTVVAACIDSGVSPPVVGKALQRLRESRSNEGEALLLMPIVRAVERRCAALRRAVEDSTTANAAEWWDWRLNIASRDIGDTAESFRQRSFRKAIAARSSE